MCLGETENSKIFKWIYFGLNSSPTDVFLKPVSLARLIYE